MSEVHDQELATIVKTLIILVVETAGAVIVAVGKDIFVTAAAELPLRFVKNGAVDTLGGKELISKDVFELLINVHKILATVPFLYSATGARLFNIFVMI